MDGHQFDDASRLVRGLRRRMEESTSAATPTVATVQSYNATTGLARITRDNDGDGAPDDYDYVNSSGVDLVAGQRVYLVPVGGGSEVIGGVLAGSPLSALRVEQNDALVMDRVTVLNVQPGLTVQTYDGSGKAEGARYRQATISVASFSIFHTVTASDDGSDTPSTTDTVNFFRSIDAVDTLPTGTWTLVVSGGQLLKNSGGNLGHRVSIWTDGGVLVAAGTAHVNAGNAGLEARVETTGTFTGIAGGRNIFPNLDFRAGTGGEVFCRNPTVRMFARRTGN